MKKVLTLSLILALVLCSAVPAFAADNAALKAASQEVTFSSEIVKMSLDDMYKKLETSPTMEQIELAKKMDNAVATGYLENYQDYNAAKRGAEAYSQGYVTAATSTAFWAYNSATGPMLKKMRTFGAEMVEPNNDARIGAFKRDSFEQYYNLKNMERTVAIAKDNMSITEQIANNVALKYKVGTASKMENMTAQSDVLTATDTYTAALNGYNLMRMSFNMYCGYDLDQNVVLTNELEEAALPETSLEDAVASALENRLEIKEAGYNAEMAQLNFNQYKAYPSSSSRYLSAQASLAGAQMAADIQPDAIKIDVTQKYTDMMQAYQEVQSGKSTVENAKETARLAQLQYNAGMCTLTQLEQAQLGSYNAQLNYQNALLKYNLAVEDFNLCQGIGTKPVTLVSQ